MGKFIISEEEKKRIRLLYELGGAQTTSTNVDVSCIGFSGEEYKEITTALLNSDGAGKPVHIWRVWPDGRAIYVESGDKYKYTYTCSKTKAGVVEITDVESSQMDEYKLFNTNSDFTQEMQNSESAKYTRNVAKYLNSYYKINLNSAQSGNWKDKDYNDTLKKFMEEKGISVWICKEGDGYCGEGDNGLVTTKEIDKLNNIIFSNKKEPAIPTELVNSDGVKKFQDWLDLNASDEKLGAGKGWATGFRNGTLKKQGGYGRFGPRTSKAFQSYYKYYKENKPISATNTTANTGTATNSTTTNTQNTYRPSKMMDR